MMRYGLTLSKYIRKLSGKSALYGKNFINNEFVESLGSKTYKRHNPYNGVETGFYSDSTSEDAEKAINSAQEAFLKWSNTPNEFRANEIAKIALNIKYNISEISKIITTEMGKPISESLAEVNTSISLLNFFSEETKRIHGKFFDQSLEKKLMILHQPHGVVGLITPWNFPLNMIIRSLGALLGAGCTAVIKPSPETPLTALYLGYIIKQSQLPEGIVNIITASHESSPNIGDVFCHHPLVRHISFTGSTQVGKLLLSKASSTVKRCSMELGGNAPAIIFESADIDKTVKNLILAKFRNSGQTCISPNRIFVHKNIYDSFLEKFENAVSRLEIGSPENQNTQISCLYDEKGLEKIKNIVDKALSQGAKIHYQKKNLKNIVKNLYPPTILIDCNQTMEISQCELFGPICCIYKFDDQHSVFKEMNDCYHGLAAYIYSQDMRQIYETIKELKFGLISVNDITPSNYLLPFGGHKESGIGSEMGTNAIYEYMDTQSIVLQI